MADELPDLSDLVAPFDVLGMVRAAGVLPAAITEHIVSAQLLPMTEASPQLIIEIDERPEVHDEIPQIRAADVVRDEPVEGGYLDEWRLEFAGVTFTPSAVLVRDDVVCLAFRDASEEPA